MYQCLSYSTHYKKNCLINVYQCTGQLLTFHFENIHCFPLSLFLWVAKIHCADLIHSCVGKVETVDVITTPHCRQYSMLTMDKYLKETKC